jgi:hypothetical protein
MLWESLIGLEEFKYDLDIVCRILSEKMPIKEINVQDRSCRIKS